MSFRSLISASQPIVIVSRDKPDFVLQWTQEKMLNNNHKGNSLTKLTEATSFKPAEFSRKVFLYREQTNSPVEWRFVVQRSRRCSTCGCENSAFAAQTLLTLRSMFQGQPVLQTISIRWSGSLFLIPAHWLSTLSCCSINIRQKYLCVCLVVEVGCVGGEGRGGLHAIMWALLILSESFVCLFFTSQQEIN